MPRVSVMIPTYNCARFLGFAIDSVLTQTYADYEIVVIDDGSTDDTQECIAKYGSKVRYFYQSNQGLSAARNLALDHATGEFIAYIDADDMWYPGKLETQVAFLDSHRECGLVHTEVSVIDEQGKVIHACFNRETNRPVPQGKCLNDLLRRCHIQVPTVMERRSWLDRAGRFDLRLLVAQDYLHWIMLAIAGAEVGYIDQALGMYRWRQSSLMSNQWRLLDDFVKIYEIVLTEHNLERTHGAEMIEIVKEQLYTTQRQLAYVERQECSTATARHRLYRLIRQWPLQLELYVDLVKTYVFRSESQRPLNPS